MRPPSLSLTLTFPHFTSFQAYAAKVKEVSTLSAKVEELSSELDATAIESEQQLQSLNAQVAELQVVIQSLLGVLPDKKLVSSPRTKRSSKLFACCLIFVLFSGRLVFQTQAVPAFCVSKTPSRL